MPDLASEPRCNDLYTTVVRLRAHTGLIIDGWQDRTSLVYVVYRCINISGPQRVNMSSTVSCVNQIFFAIFWLRGLPLTTLSLRALSRAVRTASCSLGWV